MALDDNKYIAAILMDLSKAFDCLPHDLLLQKLKTYGVTDTAVKLLQNYLSGRKQCVKIGSSVSNWQGIYKGVPQGSILGPVLFNIFINDIFYFINDSSLYNYADDNTLSYVSHDLEALVSTLENDSLTLIDWFTSNQMKVNPDKFQAISVGKKSHSENITFDVRGTTIKCEDKVKLLGVTIDFELKFNSHIANMCQKASRQLNVLKRIGKYLNRLGKLTIYHSFILSNFNYCPVTWHFCSEQNSKKMEKIQERALKFIYDDCDSSYESLLEKSKLPSLKIRRIRAIALEAFKIINKQSPLYLHDLISMKENKYSFRYKHMASIPRVRTTRYGLNSFKYFAAKTWNELPEHFKQEASFGQFKNMINSWNGSSCHCNACL
ncbi:Uncharacterised protein r2_g3912 [Pycnogonum litorale]